MAKQRRSQGDQPGSKPTLKAFQLDVKFEGTFVFALRTATQGSDSVVGIDVFAPDCGHMYSAGIEGQWNNPHRPQGQLDIPGDLLMVEARRHCLELQPPSNGVLSLLALRKNIGQKNLWPTTGRPVMSGWDLILRVPVPSGVNCWTTEAMKVKGTFSGTDTSLFTQMGMVQTLTYLGVTSFTLKGSPLPVKTPIPDANGKVTFTINAEPACIPSLEHQRRAAEALAKVTGLDLRLEKPMHAMMTSNLLRARTGSCMGGAIVQPLQ